MPEGLIDSAAQAAEPGERRIYGVVVAQVVENIDSTRLGRVKIQLPWLPQVTPWARVAMPSAGMLRGMYFMPQVGDEVLVAFLHGDIREPYVIGSLWNGLDRPPILSPTDAVSKRLIRTPLGHEIEFDEVAQTVTITNSTQQTVTLGPDSIELKNTPGTATVTLDTLGNVTIESALAVQIKGTTVSIEGQTVSIKGNATVSVNGGTACNIQGGVVKIN